MNKLEKAIIKFNNGRLALLCSGCRKILKSGNELSPKEIRYALRELEYLPPAYCEKCDNLSLKEQVNT